MSVLVMCASRDRPNYLCDMLESFMSTSTDAEVAIYLDHDDVEQYAPVMAEFDKRTRFIVSHRIGHAPALNEICRRSPGYDAYGVATDDSLFLTPRWDRWALRTARSFPGGIGAFAPFFGLMGRMDFPWVTSGWVDVLGTYTPYKCRGFYFNITIQILAEQAGCIAFAEEGEFAMSHRSVAGTEHDTDMDKALREKSMTAFIDGRDTCYWLQDGRREALAKLNNAIAAKVTA